ncbi:MAG: ECF transporter S component [Candidatus Geothermarchaeales archaeon]
MHSHLYGVGLSRCVRLLPPCLQASGFFNIGESGLYLAALIGEPYVGAFSGGVGSIPTDLALRWEVFAPARFLMKGTEGSIVCLCPDPE